MDPTRAAAFQTPPVEKRPRVWRDRGDEVIKGETSVSIPWGPRGRRPPRRPTSSRHKIIAHVATAQPPQARVNARHGAFDRHSSRRIVTIFRPPTMRSPFKTSPALAPRPAMVRGHVNRPRAIPSPCMPKRSIRLCHSAAFFHAQESTD